MSLPRTVIGFSDTDISFYQLMTTWKDTANIDFIFTSCNLQSEKDLENEQHIKSICRERINPGDKYILLIGEDTKYKYKYVLWEAQVAIEKGCTIIGVNLDGSHRMVESKCPEVIKNTGALFVPFSPKIVRYALENYIMRDDGSYHYIDRIYRELGYFT
jgi:hypothetical protein